MSHDPLGIQAGDSEQASVIVGTIESVYEDLGPSLKVCVQLDGGGTCTFDARELPVAEDVIRLLVGRRVRIQIFTKVEVLS